MGVDTGLEVEQWEEAQEAQDFTTVLPLPPTFFAQDFSMIRNTWLPCTVFMLFFGVESNMGCVIRFGSEGTSTHVENIASSAKITVKS